jgi:DnaJ-class molecular chaperone
MKDQAVACLMFGIYEKNATGVVDRRECSVCHGDHCPYEVGEPQHGACPACFGTGLAPEAVFDLEEVNQSQCPRCGGTGKV